MSKLSEAERTYGDCRWYPTLKTRYTIFYGDLNSGNEIEFEVDNQRQRGNDDVRGVIVCKINITKIPETIHQDFKNIVCLHISSCDEIKEICRADLSGLEKLREIAITGTMIEVIPADLFNDMVNLEVIELLMNQIKFIGRECFKPLKKIAYIDLGLNVNINAIFVGDPFKFPDGIDNSDKCETLEQLHKLIAKMKPPGGRKKIIKKTAKINSRLVDPSKTHFKSGKAKKCAINITEQIKKAKRQLASTKKKLKESSRSPVKLVRKKHKKTNKVVESASSKSPLKDQSDWSEASTLVNPKMSKSTSSRSSTRFGSSSPDKKNNLAKKIKLMDFDKSRSNSIEKNISKISEEHFSEHEFVEDYYEPQDTVEVLKPDNSDTKAKLKSILESRLSESPKKISESTSNDKNSLQPTEKPKPLPHIIIHRDNNSKSFSLMSDKVNESIKIVMKPQPIPPITILRQGEIRIKRTDQNGGEISEDKTDMQGKFESFVREKLEERKGKKGKKSLPQEPQDFQQIEDTLAMMHSDDQISSPHEEISNGHREITTDEAVAIDDFIEAAKDIVTELTPKEPIDYSHDIEEIEMIEEVPIEELPLKLEEVEVESEQFSIVENQNVLQSFAIERYKILPQNDKFGLEPIQQNHLPEMIHTVATNSDEIIYQEDLMSSKDLEEVSQDNSLAAIVDKAIANNLSTKPIFIRDENLSEPDLIIKVDEKSFSVHRSIIAAHSSILAEKLNLKPNLKSLELKFITPQTFEIIRDFIYGQNAPPKNFKILEDVFRKSSLLKIEELKDLTSKMLIEIIDIESVGTIYQLGTDYENEEMKKRAFEVGQSFLPVQIEKEEQMSDLHILKEFVRLKYLMRGKIN